MFVGLDTGELTPAIERELRHGFNMNRVRAKIDAQHNAEIAARTETRSVEGLGEKVAQIPPDAFHYWGQRQKLKDLQAGIVGTTGYEIWEDKQFLREFLRDNPECRVKSGGTKLQVGFAGSKRSSTRYADS